MRAPAMPLPIMTSFIFFTSASLGAQRHVAPVAGEREALARARQVDGEDPSDRRGGAVGHHHHAVGEQRRLVHVVGHHEHGASRRGDDPHQLVLEVRPRQGIERAEGLVEQQDLGLDRKRAGDTDALLHAA